PCRRRDSYRLLLAKAAELRNVLLMTFSLTAYIEAAMELARYDKLEDGSFAGESPKLPGVIAFAKTLRQCEHLLRSTLEDCILAKAMTPGSFGISPAKLPSSSLS